MMLIMYVDVDNDNVDVYVDVDVDVFMEHLNHYMENISEWGYQWKLSFNPENKSKKCYYLRKVINFFK